MQRQALVAVAMAAMLALAGCSGVIPGEGGDSGGSGTVNFYVSDEKNQIEDFEHLNVTVTKVGIHRVDDNSTEENESGWIEKDVGNVTVDLTELQGKNASQLGDFSAPNGTYNKVFIHVGDINATLKDGSSANVKLPSEKLHINKRFTVGAGEEVDFVFDVGIFKAGQSGKYILKPVVSQSGTGEEVEIEKKPSAKKGEGKQDKSEKGKQGGKNTTATEHGKVTFYVSDEKNAIDQFEHLNVTISKVGIHRTGNASGNESGDGGGSWVEKDVNNTTVDLTELQGANATSLGVIDAPNGTYDKVFVYVSAVDGTLKDGTSVNVKLPSSKLHINKQFTVGAGEEVKFVYDISVFKAGGSGKYILKPVVSESGTSEEVEIEEKPEAKKDEQENETEQEETAAALNVSVSGNVTAGENVTASVTQNGSAVANATVTVNGEEVGQTSANGTIVVTVPENAETLEIEVTKGEMEGSATAEVSSSGSGSASLRPPMLG